MATRLGRRRYVRAAVCAAVVARVFLDHVQVDPAQHVVVAGARFVKTESGHGCPRPSDTRCITGWGVGGARDVSVEAVVRARLISCLPSGG